MLKKLRVLWADDQPDVARTLGSSLAALKPEIRYVTSGEEALKVLRSEYQDVAIVDLLMPPSTWGGLWTLDELRKSGIRTPVIVLSGEGRQTETIKALRLGAVDYVTKESADRELLECVAGVLKKQWESVQMAIGTGFPIPLAVPFKRYQGAASAVTRLRKLIEFFEHALRFTCMVGLSDSSLLGVERPELSKGFLQLSRPTMGNWNQMRVTLASAVNPRRQFHGFNWALESGDIDRVIRARNDLAHGGDPSEPEAASLLAELERSAQLFLKGFWQRGGVKLFLAQSMKLFGGRFETSGVELSGESFALPRFSISLSKAIDSDRVYVAEPGVEDPANIEPYVLLEEGVDPGAWRVLVFDGWTWAREADLDGTETIRYLDLQSGKRSAAPKDTRRLAAIEASLWKQKALP